MNQNSLLAFALLFVVARHHRPRALLTAAGHDSYKPARRHPPRPSSPSARPPDLTRSNPTKDKGNFTSAIHFIVFFRHHVAQGNGFVCLQMTVTALHVDSIEQRGPNCDVKFFIFKGG